MKAELPYRGGQGGLVSGENELKDDLEGAGDPCLDDVPVSGENELKAEQRHRGEGAEHRAYQARMS